MVVCLFLFVWFLAGLPHKAEAYTTTFTASGSWQAPAGVTSVTVEAWGGGGAGGGRTTNGVSGGAGGGAYASKTITVTPLTSYSYTIGAGGVGGTGNGPNGADTLWADGSALKAAGGKGGASTTTKGLGATTADSVGDIKFKGGDGADGASTIGGGGGGGAGSTAAGNNASGGTGGITQTQDGGAGGNYGNNVNGLAGALFGAGGGGVYRTSGSRSGGTGGAGAIRITYKSTSTLSTQSGYYMGNGTSSRSITGLGFAPDFVLIKADTTAGAAAFKTSLMPGANMAVVTATADNTASNLILDSNGFTVGASASVNTANVRYTWIAFKGSDCTATGIFCVGQYTGTGAATKTVNTGFQPNFVMVKRTTAVAAHFHTASQPANETLYLINAIRDTTGNFIKTFGSSGFDVGVTDNAASGVYTYIAFKNTANTFAEGTYAGNAADYRNITGVGFQPDIVMVKNATNATANSTSPVMSNPASYGDNATVLSATANAANYIQNVQSDGFQVGTNVFVNGTGDTYYWVSFKGVPPPLASGTFKMKTGTYTGNGTGQSISGLGFTPDLVIIKDNSTNYQVFRTSLMKGDTTAYLSNAVANFAIGITAMDIDGFTLGASTIVNTSANTYHWQAFGGAWNPETKSGAADFAVGALTGNGLDNRNITGLPWQPDFVAMKRNSTSAGVWRSSAMAGDLSTLFGASPEAANYIQTLNSDGFQIGSNAAVNTSASLMYWFSFKNGSGFAAGSYTGNSTDNRNITGVGFQPDLVWVKRSTAVNGVSRPSSLSGDTTQYFANLANVTDRIQDLNSDGFQVGGNQTETNAASGIYRYIAWRDILNIAVSVSITTDGTVSYGTLGSGQNTSTVQLTDTQTAKNDGNVTADLNIKTDAPAGWSIGASPGSDIFVHEFSVSGGNNWTKFLTQDTYQSLATNLAADATQNFDLRFTAPNPSTSASQKTLTITVQAVQH